MKIIFAGTPAFAAAALNALHEAGHEVALVLTQPDRPAGRGLKSTASAVAEVAERLRLPLRKPVSLKDDVIVTLLEEIKADVMVVAAYGLLLPQAVLDRPKYGCLNIHGSVLPRWRGAAPVQRAIEAGDAETGITIMKMDAGLDTGAIVLEKKLVIASDETSATLLVKLAELGADAILEALDQLPFSVPRPQPATGACYARKIAKSEARIDWSQAAVTIERRLRAFDPYPGCEAVLNGEPLKIWRAQLVSGNGNHQRPGVIVELGENLLTVACGEGQLRILVVQKPGGRRMTVDEFLRGRAVSAGVALS